MFPVIVCLSLAAPTLTQDQVIRALEQGITKFSEAPLLSGLVEKGELPSFKERIPNDRENQLPASCHNTGGTDRSIPLQNPEQCFKGDDYDGQT